MKEKRGILLVLSTALISGFAIFISRFGVKVINPYIFTGLKNLLTVLWLVGIIFVIGEWRSFQRLKRREWLTLIIIGFVGGSIPFLLFFKGLSITSGSEASLIHKTLFLPVILMARLFLKEKLNKNLIMGAILLLLGNVFLLKLQVPLILDKGDLLIFLATLFWAVEQIISKRAVATISPRIVAWGRLGFGFGFILLFWVITGQVTLLGDLTLRQFNWLWITALVLLGYVLTWYTGLKYVRVSVATCILTLGAPITTLLSLLQGASISLLQIMGLLLISGGLFYILSQKEVVGYVRH